jgi:hypothetical protein
MVEALIPGRDTVAAARASLASTPGLPMTLGVIPPSVHGFFDYLLGAGAIVAPRLLGFADEPRAARALQFQGMMVLLYSVLTDYQWGVVRIIRFPTHLLIDALGATFLLLAPRLLAFRRSGGWYAALGLFELAITFASQSSDEGAAGR